MCCECAGSSRLPDSRKDVPARQEAISPGIEKTDRPVPSFNSNSVTWPTGCLQALQAQLCFRFEPGSSGITEFNCQFSHHLSKSRKCNMRTVCSMEKGYSTACFSVPSPPPAPDCPQRDSWSENSQHHFMRLVFRSWNCWHHLCTRVKGQRCEDLFWQIVSCQVSEVLSCSAYMLITAVQTFESVPKVDPTLFHFV